MVLPEPGYEPSGVTAVRNQVLLAVDEGNAGGPAG
jgi:hypothetical protein